MDIKEKFNNLKKWVKDHKKVVAVSGVTIALAGIGGVMASKNAKQKDEVKKLQELADHTDYGRDCTMQFIVNETGEVLGEIPCTELYANENIEDYEYYKK
jgi:hypothetical protein